MFQQNRQRTLKNDPDVAAWTGMSHQILHATQLLERVSRHGELHLVALVIERSDHRRPDLALLRGWLLARSSSTG
jgi:hypothetical protein